VPADVFLSVVIPFFNEEANVDALFARLLPSLRGMGRSFEVVCIDDGSKDLTVEKLTTFARANPEIVVQRFARNFGQHAAVTAGLAAARGAFVVTLDADLQNPPEEIAKLVSQFDEGVRYPEAKINEILKRHHPDTATLRREFIMTKKMERRNGVYWRV
jgi:glycosyltransferase involved in cell wall biosynthesis